MKISPIAKFESPLKSKFGIPRQSGLVSELTGRVSSAANIEFHD